LLRNVGQFLPEYAPFCTKVQQLHCHSCENPQVAQVSTQQTGCTGHSISCWGRAAARPGCQKNEQMITRLHSGFSDGSGINTPESSNWKFIGGEKCICATVQTGSFYGASDILYCSRFYYRFCSERLKNRNKSGEIRHITLTDSVVCQNSLFHVM
jgi:hypothetical protein